MRKVIAAFIKKYGSGYIESDGGAPKSNTIILSDYTDHEACIHKDGSVTFCGGGEYMRRFDSVDCFLRYMEMSK